MDKLKLMADYGCLPLWDRESIGEIDPYDLAISDQLKVDLMAWADEFDAALNLEDGTLVGFLDEESRRFFNQQGQVLFERLKQELGGGTDFKYVAPFDN